MTGKDIKVLANELEHAMLNDAEQARSLGYNPTRFNMMVRREGGLATAQKLLRPGPVPELRSCTSHKTMNSRAGREI